MREKTLRSRVTDATGRVTYYYGARPAWVERLPRPFVVEPCGHWDHRLGRLVSTESVTLVERRKAPGA